MTDGAPRTAGFRLPSLAVSCSYDEPPPMLTLPAVLEDRHSGIAVIEGAFALPTRMCRFVRPEGLLGIRLADPLPATLRVTLRLRSDSQAEQRWLEKRQRQHEVRARLNLAYQGPDPVVRGRHRLLRISAQGRPRALMLLEDPSTAEVHQTTQRVVFDVRREEIDESRLLLVSLGAARRTPAWNPERRLAEPLVGLQGTSMGVRAGDDKGPVGVSTGLQGTKGWQPWSHGIGYAVLNRGAHPVRLRLATSESPGRLLGFARPHPRGWPELVEVLDVDGEAQSFEVPRPTSDGVATVELPRGRGPAFLRLLGRDESAIPNDLGLRVSAGTE